MRFRPEALAHATGGRLIRSSARPIASAFIDSRTPIRDGLFVPIVAERDGHEFLQNAVSAGASAVIVAAGREVAAGELDLGDITIVEVDDTEAALTRLGAHARDAVDGAVVAVTGSNGKTTTRALVQAVLETAGSDVLCTAGNFNNHLGVPLTLVGEPHRARAAVIEMGMSAPGEVDHLAKIVRPDVAVITSIALEHVETMGTLEAIAKAEFEVAAHLPDGGALVLPIEDARLAALVTEELAARCKIYRFGEDADADVGIEDVEVGSPTRATLRIGDHRLAVSVQTFGAHNIRNAAAAVCVGLHLGLDPANMVAAISAVEPVGDRGRAIEWEGHTLVADCYNANPGSMEAALRSLAATRVSSDGPLIAVLGDMLELGPDTEALHTEVGGLCAQLGLDAVLGFGPLAGRIIQACGDRPALHVDAGTEQVDAAAAWIRSQLDGSARATVLFKASRGIRLERVIERLRGA